MEEMEDSFEEVMIRVENSDEMSVMDVNDGVS
jgi:hypothetical protein